MVSQNCLSSERVIEKETRFNNLSIERTQTPKLTSLDNEDGRGDKLLASLTPLSERIKEREVIMPSGAILEDRKPMANTKKKRESRY